MPGSTYNFGSGGSDPDEQDWKTKTGAYVNDNGKVVTEKLFDAVNTSALSYGYDQLVPPAPPALTALLSARANSTTRLVVAAMETKKFDVKSGGTTVTLSPAPGALPTAGATLNATAANTSHTLVLQGIKLLRRPRAPLSVFLNLPKGAPPRLNDPYYVGTLNFFNFDLSTGTPMDHSDDNAHADHKMAGAEARFDVTDILQRQRAKGQWDGGPISVTISTISADAPGAGITYVSIDSVSLVP
jgi:tyrosinase